MPIDIHVGRAPFIGWQIAACNVLARVKVSRRRTLEWHPIGSLDRFVCRCVFLLLLNGTRQVHLEGVFEPWIGRKVIFCSRGKGS